MGQTLAIGDPSGDQKKKRVLRYEIGMMNYEMNSSYEEFIFIFREVADFNMKPPRDKFQC